MDVSRRQAQNYVQSLKAKNLLVVNERSDPAHGQITSEYDFGPLIQAVVQASTPAAPTPPKFPSRGDTTFISRAPANPGSPEEDSSEKDSVEEEKSNFRPAPHLISDDYDEARRTIVDYTKDLAREFADPASLRASTTRALNIFCRAGVDLDAFVEAMLAARAIVKERSAAIKSTTTEPGKPFPTKRQMGYFFAVLENHLGLKDPVAH